MARIVKRGEGITARMVLELSDRNPEDAAEIAGDIAAADKLKDAGIDPHFGFTTVYIRETLADVMERAGPKPWPEDSEPDFARRILEKMKFVDMCLADGSAGLAARFAFEAGDLWRAARMKLKWENDALRGRKTYQAAKKAARQTGARHEYLRESRFARMTELIQRGLSVSNAASICAREGLGSAGAIRAQWYRRRK